METKNRILDYRKHAKQLRQSNRPLVLEDLSSTEFQDNLHTMETLLKIDGVGLAAAQIDWHVKLFMLCIDEQGKDSSIRVFLNPRIIQHSKITTKQAEGCLSLPGLFLEVVRPMTIEWEYTDLAWQNHRTESRDFFARAVLHETDHCESKVFIDHATSVQKLKVNRWLKD